MRHKTIQERGRDALALGFLALCVLAFNWPFAIGAIPYDADNVLFSLPFFSLMRERPFPLWDPFQFCGMPLVGNLQYAMFYPARWVFAFADATSAFGPFVFGHWVVASWGAYALGRSLGFSRAAAVFGGVAFGCGSFMQARVINPTLFISGPWFPAVVAAAVFARRTASARGAAFLALSFAVLTVAGSPHMAFYAAIAIALVWIVDPASIPDAASKPRLAGTIPLLALSALLAALMILPLAFHAWELLGGSVRAAASFADVTADPLLPFEIPRLWLGGFGTPEYGDKTNYAGMLTLALVAWAAATEIRRRADLRPAAFGAALAILGILFALGSRGGLYHALYLIPGFRFLIGPTRGLVLFAAGWCVISMWALDRFLGHRDSRSGRIGVVVTVAAAIFIVVLGTATGGVELAMDALRAPRFAEASAMASTGSGVALALSCALLLALSSRRIGRRAVVAGLLLFQLADLARFHQRLVIRPGDTSRFDEPPTVAALKRLGNEQPFRALGWNPMRKYPMFLFDEQGAPLIEPKYVDWFHVYEPQGYDPMMQRDYVELVNRLSGRCPTDDPFRTLHVASPRSVFTDLTGARYVVGNPFVERVPFDGSSQFVTLDPPRQVTGIEIVSLADRASRIPDGTAVGIVTIHSADGATTAIPVRLGVETADVSDRDGPPPHAHPGTRTASRWPVLDLSRQRERWLANYVAALPLDAPTTVSRISWTPVLPNVPFVISSLGVEAAPSPSDGRRFQRVWQEGPYSIWQNSQALPLAYFVHETTRSQSLADCARILRDGAARLSKFAVLNEADRVATTPTDAPETVSVRRLSCNSIEVTAQTATPGLLVLSETNYPGWRVLVDGTHRVPLRVNGVFQGVAIDRPGRHELLFEYSPPLLRPLIAVAGAAVVVALLLALRRRPHRTA